MLEIYLDTADLAQIQRLHPILPLRGITTNPSILAKGGLGINTLLPELTALMGTHARFHVQVLSETVEAIVAEARQLHALPYDIVVKIPAHAAGLAAIKILKQDDMPILATAIYNSQQGMLAALQGADYLAPYLNRIDNLGFDGLGVVNDLQQFIETQGLPCRLLVASFKNVQQVLEVLRLGVGAITLPAEIAWQILDTPLTDKAVQQFSADWEAAFGQTLSFAS